MGNSYGQLLHAHLLSPVSIDMTSKFAQVGQKSISARNGVKRQGTLTRFEVGLIRQGQNIACFVIGQMNLI